MQPRTRHRLIRSIVAALMQSDLTVEELRELADELATESFGRDLGAMLRDVLFTVREAEVGKSNKREREVGQLSVEAIAMEIVRRRKLPRKVVVDLILRVSPRFRSQQAVRSGTISGMLRKFFQTSAPHEQNEFLNLLDKGTAEDPYLRGIVDRS
jgi:hypothetical protein